MLQQRTALPGVAKNAHSRPQKPTRAIHVFELYHLADLGVSESVSRI
jgi:hypothetical protein